MKKIMLAGALCLGVFALATPGYATSISYELNYEFSGGQEPMGPAPWLTLIFDDSGGTGSVQMTLISGLVGGEFVGELLFNFDPTFDVTNLIFSHVSGDTLTSISKQTDFFKADGAGDFDVSLGFDIAPPDKRFGVGETMVYDITLAGITASSFDFLSTASVKGEFHAAAHIQGIGTEGQGSGWIGDSSKPVPEPATMLLFGTGLVGLAGIARRKRN